MLVSEVRIHAPERGPALHTAASSAVSVMTGTSAFSRYHRVNEQVHGLGQVLFESSSGQQHKHSKFTLQSCCESYIGYLAEISDSQQMSVLFISWKRIAG